METFINKESGKFRCCFSTQIFVFQRLYQTVDSTNKFLSGHIPYFNCWCQFKNFTPRRYLVGEESGPKFLTPRLAVFKSSDNYLKTWCNRLYEPLAPVLGWSTQQSSALCWWPSWLVIWRPSQTFRSGQVWWPKLGTQNTSHGWKPRELNWKVNLKSNNLLVYYTCINFFKKHYLNLFLKWQLKNLLLSGNKDQHCFLIWKRQVPRTMKTEVSFWAKSFGRLTFLSYLNWFYKVSAWHDLLNVSLKNT